MTKNTANRQIDRRLLPGPPARACKLAGQAGASSFVWNEMLARQKAAHKTPKNAGGKPPSVPTFTVGNGFTSLRCEAEWLDGFLFAVTRYALKSQADARKAAFGDGGFPEFKSRLRESPDACLLDANIKGDQRNRFERKRTRLRRRRLQRRQANRRTNWQLRASRKIACRESTEVIEKPNATGTTRSPKGTVECPCGNVKKKSGLNRETLYTAWRGLRQMHAYKSGRLVEADPSYTSQTCYACGLADHADPNAAGKIPESGIGATARQGELTTVAPATREINAMDA
ncbi:MAG: hypothetical protein OXI01_12465 [Albidovulum sp.]|nr:hypothetical protein [Albidovulum sp.]